MTEKLPNPFATAAAENGEPGLAPDPAQDLVGRVIGGRYRVTGIVGRGGMGVVYAGEHLELALPVAIKVLPTSFARDVENLKRFEREARTASRVRHPNVVTVFDLGRLDTGEPYLAMELLTGRDLSDVLEGQAALPLRQVLDILDPLAAALDALHSQGVVHRDIKPSNIFFSRGAGGVETLKLVDFGLAALHTVDENAARLTRSGHVIGTAIYMAPEGARGALVGPSGDIYSLGVVAFELLTGQPPFDGNPMAVLMDKVTTQAPTLEAVARRPFDARLEAAIASAISRKPEKRPASSKEFVDALRVVLESGGSARSDPPPAMSGLVREPRGTSRPRPSSNDVTADEELPRLPSSRTPMIAGAVVLALALASGGAWYAVRSTPPTPAPLPTTPTPTPEIVVPDAVPPEEPPAVVEVAPLPVGVALPEVEAPHADHVRPSTHTTPRTPTTPEVAPPPAETHVAPPEPTHEATPETTPEPTPASTDRTAALLRDASSAMLHGEIPRARELYLEATQAAPRNTAAWRGLGLASERLRLLPEARRAYARYLELAPDARDAATVRERMDRLGG